MAAATVSLVLLLLLVAAGRGGHHGHDATDPSNSSIVSSCIAQFQNKNSPALDADCDMDCFNAAIQRGCGVWREAVAPGANCQSACHSSTELVLLSSRTLFCVMSCNIALNQHFQRLRDLYGAPPAPSLVADSLTATSLSLEWGGEAGNAVADDGRLYGVQWRYEEVPGAHWVYCCNRTLLPTTSRTITDLIPYTKYKFRVVALVSNHSAAETLKLFSQASVVMGTLAAGLPQSPPQSVRAVAVDASRVSVTWQPAAFPRGPVLSYVLTLAELPPALSPSPLSPAYSAVKEVPVVEGQPTSYLWQKVPSGRDFSVGVAARNWAGQGPAATANVSTPPEPQTLSDQDPPRVLLCTTDAIYNLELDIVGDMTDIYRSNNIISGCAVHLRRGWVFVLEAPGVIWRLPLDGSSGPMRVADQSVLGVVPTALSVDWLNDELYVVGEASASKWRIVRCSFEGFRVAVALAGFNTQPTNLQIDPYNGYMFWTVKNTRNLDSLFRLDLAEPSNGVRHGTRPELIVDNSTIGAFTIDHAGFRLLVADEQQNTVFAISLDGKEVSNIRQKTQEAEFRRVASLVAVHGLFYWTDGINLKGEERDNQTSRYYHHIFPHKTATQLAMLSLAELAQPVPVAVNPPTALQAILGHSSAKLAWQPPHLVGGQGKGAWQEWQYEVEIKEEMTGSAFTIRNITATSLSISPIKPYTRYILKVSANSAAGRGPWSTEFRGRSFRAPSPGHKEAAIVWGAEEGLVQTDTTGDNLETLVHADMLKDMKSALYVTTVAWFEDILYLSTNSTKTMWFNSTSRAYGYVNGIDSAGSIAVDWLGKRLYWSNPKQTLIKRCSLKGEEQEPLPILEIAKEIHVDSLNAYLYWSTSYSVASARLNGHNKTVYYPPELFSGKQVMGLTLDTERGIVFWIVRGNDGSVLYRAPMARDGQLGGVEVTAVTPEKVANLLNPVVQGPLCYFNDHLLWLQDGNNAVIADVDGQGAAVISDSGLSGLYVVAIIDPSSQTQPKVEGGGSVVVIPEPVASASVKFTGTWNDFNLTWVPVSNVNYGTVFYDIKIVNQITKNETLVETEDNWLRFPEVVAPHTPLRVSVRAFTFWGSAARETPLLLHTPAASPTAPERLRVFVSFERANPMSDSKVKVRARWGEPSSPNGALLGYRLRVCNGFDPDVDDEDCDNVPLPPSQRSHEFNHLSSYSLYSLQVWAQTEAGEGAGSELVLVDTSRESPLPQLLVAPRNGGIDLVDVDPDGGSRRLVQTSDTVASIAVLASEQRLFWLGRDSREIHSCAFNCSNHFRGYQLINPGSSLTADWVARKIYWTEQLISNSQIAESQIWSLDLVTHKQQRLASRQATVSSLQVSPLTSSLFWVEDDLRNVQIMRSDIERVTPVPFFTDADNCTCPRNRLVGRPLHLDAVSEQLVWSDHLTGNIWAAKLDGCNCELIAKETAVSVVTSDPSNVFWLNHNGYIDSASRPENFKEYKASHFALPQNHVAQILAVGEFLQPFPDRDCLVVDEEYSPQMVSSLVSSTSNSLTLRMPRLAQTSPEEICGAVALPSVRFRVYYGLRSCADDEPPECDASSLHNCNYNETFDSEVNLVGLEPYTCYVVLLAASNYYTELLGKPQVLGPSHVFRTSEGVPSEVRDVQVQLLNPWSVRVSWLPPQETRGSAVRYELLWSTEGAGLLPRQFGELPVVAPLLAGTRLSAVLDNLAPDQIYYIRVRANSKSNLLLRSESARRMVKTLPEPDDLRLSSASGTELNVSWSSSLPPPLASLVRLGGTVEFAQRGSNLWQPAEPVGRGLFKARPLSPKTVYQFRLRLSYSEPNAPEDAATPYLWPPDARFTFETLGDRPSAPGTPHITHLHSNVYQVSWEAARNNGADVEIYLLEGREGLAVDAELPIAQQQRSSREAPGDIEDDFSNGWTLLYNGSETHWVIRELRPNVKYSFRARARNAYGDSNWSASSELFDSSEFAQRHDETRLRELLLTGLPLLTALCLCMLSVVAVFSCVCSKKVEKSPPSPIAPLGRLGAPDVELATLRESPRGRTGRPVMQHTNELYTSASLVDELNDLVDDHLLSNTDLEIAALPHIRRDQIKLTCFLGSGAFGEVFEGEAQNLPGGQEKVAVKTLKKGATEHEKLEFLKEAQLMSNFRHEHILQMLGVCLDRDSHFIVMELMEGGDLLNYLRTSRPLARSGEMGLVDLVGMAVDVAQGCRYLEELRYVHRDLACRNCLVSFSGARRVVKIGDFGLARDVYKNDYYRKEGEGLLPVRWMSPESLMDRVFTTQSDVWAFGVIVWEILTMGQQPYPALTNQEVFNFVRDAGRLQRPLNCPDQMHNLMQRCWHTNPKCRPTFKNCLEVLLELKESEVHNPTPQLILSDIYGLGAENAAFVADNDYTAATGAGETSDEGVGGRRFVVYLPPEGDVGGPESYLRVVASAEAVPTTSADSLGASVTASDGYEVPRHLRRPERYSNVTRPLLEETPTAPAASDCSSCAD